MNKEQYYKIVKRRINNRDDLIFIELTKVFEMYSINSFHEVCHFMSQMNIESMFFAKFEENMNYSSNRLLVIFGKYFNKNNVVSYANKPIKIANKVYGNRLGNGDENSGDGWKYRGRSAIHLTGKNNYKKCGEDLGIDLINNPDFASTIECGITIAGWYWNKNEINKMIAMFPIAVDKVTLIINGGKNGLIERRSEFDRIQLILS